MANGERVQVYSGSAQVPMAIARVSWKLALASAQGLRVRLKRALRR